ncbi:hypothetical protein NHX12_033835 [Muraenolepis orangiensis]|uniref:Torsin-1A-interacting protein 1/2 AAA+ activator domain-containing protein n=1 Tax=Muraenolepis orangiensis TaxID=630683 RepID=A0A9Q0E5W1_9TELE|nr:hypothetical protein NHX12_033835 [Muraenolepis orangiensis]
MSQSTEMDGHAEKISLSVNKPAEEAEPRSEVPDSGGPIAEGALTYDPAEEEESKAAQEEEKHEQHTPREPAEHTSICSGVPKDSIGESQSTVVDEKPELKTNMPPHTEQSQDMIPEEGSADGDLSHGPAYAKDEQVDGPKVAQEMETKDEEQVMDGEPDLKTNMTPDTEQSQDIPEERSAEGVLSHGPANAKDEQVDVPKVAQEMETKNEEQDNMEPVVVTDDSNSERPYDGATTPRQRPSAQKHKPQSGFDVPEDIGPAVGVIDTKPAGVEVAVNRAGTAYHWGLAAVLVGILAIWASFLQQTPLEQKALRQVDIFLREMNVLKTQFSGQRPELWGRSKIHLEKHLQAVRPTEPVSLILAAGQGAEKTLQCLAKGLATAFSAAHNASVLQINGTATAGQDSDRVKMDIDSQLRAAFGGDDRPAAVIHRLEELPPGSTLIFYRYCDHENAAYKKPFLLFTVLLEQQELVAELRLSAVEELVDEQLQSRFLRPGGPAAFDRMDRDKYGGLWSRISHLILPVARQPEVERDGC